MIFSTNRPRAGRTIVFAAALAAFSPTVAFAHGDHGGGADGTVLPAGVVLVTLQYDVASYRPNSDDRLAALATAGVDGVHAMRTIAVPSLNLAYGMSKDFTISARLPYLINTDIREADATLPGVNYRGGVRGFGDVSVFGSYRLLHDHSQNLEAVLTLGVKAPTGRTNAVDTSGELFETEHQPGSGSWDFSAGGSVGKQVGLWSFATNGLYTWAGNGSQDTRLGNRANLGVNASYRIWSSGGADAMHLGAAGDGIMYHGGVDHGPPAASQHLDVSLGLNMQWSAMQRVAGVLDDNTGGSVVYLAPGVRYGTDKWSLFGSVGIPVVKNVNGLQSEPGVQATTGLSLRF